MGCVACHTESMWLHMIRQGLQRRKQKSQIQSVRSAERLLYHSATRNVLSVMIARLREQDRKIESMQREREHNSRKGENMAIDSRRKGAAFERRLAGILRDYGYNARRGQQYSGANGDADVIGLPGIHIEAKAVERLNIYDAMSQSKRDARSGEIPVVMHKKNNCNILVTMELEDFMSIYSEYEAGFALKEGV